MCVCVVGGGGESKLALVMNDSIIRDKLCTCVVGRRGFDCICSECVCGCACVCVCVCVGERGEGGRKLTLMFRYSFNRDKSRTCVVSRRDFHCSCFGSVCVGGGWVVSVDACVHAQICVCALCVCVCAMSACVHVCVLCVCIVWVFMS